MTRELITKLKDTIRELVERRDELGRRAQVRYIDGIDSMLGGALL